MTVNKGIDVSLSKLDVSETIATSSDHRHSPLDAFSRTKFWISTGYFPQMIGLRFIKKWIFRVIELQCKGASTVYIDIGNELTFRERLTMQEDKEGHFVIDLTSDISNEIGNKTDSSLPLGDTLRITFAHGNDTFLIVESLVIKAYQHS